jgi:lysyl-tRNA synthetase class 2
MATLKDFRDERLRKLADIKALGINPYPAESLRTHTIETIRAQFNELENHNVTTVGRIVAIRKFGKLAFIVIKDGSAETLQLFIRATETPVRPNRANSELAMPDEIGLLDTGDFIEATGPVIKTQTGEVSVSVSRLKLLTKALRPMPSVQEGFTDKEQRLRRRYIDTNVNEEVRQRYIRRSAFWQATRDFLLKEGFLEVNVPVLEHTTGGADANPFVTHMDALDQNFYLRISHELPLKRLIGAGYERVFDIGPRFRNENYSDEHLPEHIAFESYGAYQDYEVGMDLYERQMKEVALATWGTLQFENVNGFSVNLDSKWPVVKYADIMKEKFDVDVFSPDIAQLKAVLRENKVDFDEDINANRAMDSVWKIIRRESAGPFWLVHEPVAISPLAKQDPNDPRVTQRFHPVIAGTEMGNGYSELNDPVDQLNRFLEQQSMRDAGDTEAQMLDIDFVEMLEYGMPPACGWSYSERFFWAFEGVSAREGVPFPQMRYEVDEVTRALYPQIDFTHTKPAVSNMTETKQSRAEQDFSKRLVSVVRKDLEPWRVVNAVGHMQAVLGSKITNEALTSGLSFVSSDGIELPRNSQYPIITMRADEKELRKLLDKIHTEKLVHHVFIKEMQDTTDDDEIVELLKNKPMAETEVYGVSFWATNEDADRLTKGLQLWR